MQFFKEFIAGVAGDFFIWRSPKIRRSLKTKATFGKKNNENNSHRTSFQIQ